MPRCPACKSLCGLIDYEGVKIHNCGDCGGHWVTKTKLDRIVAKREIQMPEAVRQRLMDMADEQHRSEKLMCMTCGTVMEKVQFRIWNDIVLDQCPKCEKIWLDQGELEKCQIYAEYLEDHPDEWEGRDAHERQAVLEVEFDAQLEEKQEATERRVWFWGGFSILLRFLFGR